MSFDPDTILGRIKRETAKRLIAAAITLQTAHRVDLSVGNPSPHKNPAPKGEYPRLRTGNLRAGIAFAPETIGDVMIEGAISVGYRKNSIYGVYLASKGWKWIVNTYERVRGQIERILQGGTP